ncbi:hypothetical protein J2W69_000518 [Rheinheimera soli]|uniref:Uncharacterized protein n=1 Tax=Rheinheimera soli TaxID=443616 RepID=A0ABU1VW49_9GAMM|nr:hypothetical protein [Rheinheimera soli]
MRCKNQKYASERGLFGFCSFLPVELCKCGLSEQDAASISGQIKYQKES